MSKMFVKANNDLISFCTCEEAIATSGQMDCPWCGCGWLFTCMTCGKAFTFAKVVQSDISPEELSRRDTARWGLEPGDVTSEEEAEEAEWFDAANHFEEGEICVYLDGTVFPVSEKDIEFTGFYAHHKMKTLPHEAVRGDSEKLKKMLDVAYWVERSVDEDEEDDED